jgi:hypothetical protein
MLQIFDIETTWNGSRPLSLLVCGAKLMINVNAKKVHCNLTDEGIFGIKVFCAKRDRWICLTTRK